MCRVGRSGYIILLIILIILYKYIYYILPLFFAHHYVTQKLFFLQLQLQMQILSPLHSVSTVVGEVIVEVE